MSGELEEPDELAAVERDPPHPAGPAPSAPLPPVERRGASPRPARPAGTPRGTGRAYTVAFGRVWAAALSVIEQMERWTVVSSDPIRGEILLQIRGVVRRGPRSARIAVWLDDLGLTRLEAVILDSGGTGPMNRFYRRLERLLAGGG